MRRSKARSKEAIEFARDQRKNANEFADTMWQWLRNRQCCGQKFRREVPIPPYTVDFCCIDLKLVIDVDGSHHFTEEGVEHDRLRDAYLDSLGFEVLRIAGFDVVREPDQVWKKVCEFVEVGLEKRGNTKDPSPPGPLSPKRGEGEEEL